MTRVLPAKKPMAKDEIHIACINRANAPLGVDFDDLTRTLQKAYDEHFLPVWGYPVKLYNAKKPRRRQDWRFMYYDNAGRADEDGVVGYHDLAYRGQPIAFVFVEDTLIAGDQVSVTASHELFEMVIDPLANLWAEKNARTMVAYEMCDAVEEDVFLVDGMQISNFVYPTWFEPFKHARGTKYDHLGVLKNAFAMAKGGYIITNVDGHVREQFSSPAKKARFAREDRRGHRSEFRKQLSDPKRSPMSQKPMRVRNR